MKQITTRTNGSKRVSTIFKDPSKTDQSQKKATDVNEIVAKYKKTGQITHIRENQGVYADVSNIPDLIGALEQVEKASLAFDSLPATLRKKLNNDPTQFIEYLKDPANNDEAIKLGLIKPKESSPVENGEQTSVSASEQKSKTSEK